MKRRLLFVMVLALMLTALAGTVGAQSDDAAPAPDITALARYFPEGTDSFSALRTDTGYAEQLNAVSALLGQTIPEFAGVDASLLLDAVAFELTGAPYAESIDPWLGDSIAFGLVDTGALSGVLVDLLSVETQNEMDSPGVAMQLLGDVPLLFAVGLDDRAAAEAFFTGGILEPLGPVAPAEGVMLDGFDVFAFEQAPVLVALGEDAILLMTPGTVELLDFDATLANDPNFVAALAQMPQDTAYNIFSYTDTAGVVEGLERFTNSLTEMAMQQAGVMGAAEATALLQFNAAANLGDVFGPSMMGFTIIDGRSATIDTVQVFGEDAMPIDLDVNPVDPAFAEFIPAYAQLVIHDNGYGPENLAVFDVLDTITPAIDMALAEIANSEMLRDLTVGEALRLFAREADLRARDLMMVQQFLESVNITPNDPVASLLNLVDLSDVQPGGLIQNQVNTLFGGLTGLNLTEDVLGWMTGDYAFHTSLVPVESDLDFTIDFAFITEATDPAAAANVVEGLTEAADAYRLDHSVEEIGGGESLVLPAPVRLLLQATGLPADVLAETPELDMLVGANEDVYVVSSRPGAEFALTQDGPSLADDPTFAYAAETLVLPESVTVWYVGIPAFVDALPALLEAAPANELLGLAQFASLFESMTLSATMDEVASTTRLTLTFEDEPRIPAALEEAADAGMMETAPMPTTEADQAPAAEMTEEAVEEPAQQAPEPETTEEPGS